MDRRLLKRLLLPLLSLPLFVSSFSEGDTPLEETLPKKEKNRYFKAIKLYDKGEFQDAQNSLLPVLKSSNPFIRKEAQTLLEDFAEEEEDWSYLKESKLPPLSHSAKIEEVIYLLEKSISKRKLQEELEDDLEEVLYDISPNQSHKKLYKALSNSPNRSSLSKRVLSYAEGKAKLADGEWRGVLDLIEPSFTKAVLTDHPRILEDIRRVVTGKEQQSLWAKKYLSISKRGSDALQYKAFFEGSRLYISAGEKSLAEKNFAKARNIAPTELESDRALWYDLRYDLGKTQTFVKRFRSLASKIHDPTYFDDHLEQTISEAIREEDWDALLDLYSVDETKLSGEIRAQLAWNLWILQAQKTIRYKNSDALLEVAYGGEPGSYWSFLAGYILDRSPLAYWIKEHKPTPLSDESDPFVKEFLQDFIKNKEYERGANWILQSTEYISLSDLQKFADRLFKEGHNIEGIQTMSRAVYRTKSSISEKSIKLLYPNPYQRLIERKSKEFKLDPTLIFALIRTESAFEADINSRVGAVGLMQLMPATAKEQARKLDLQGYDLTDPETNIEIASSYIHWLHEREYVNTTTQMLISYNAGPGNLRKWKRQFGHIPDFLFAEAIPYQETRSYVRKIARRAMIYSELYYGDDFKKHVEDFYPELKDL